MNVAAAVRTTTKAPSSQISGLLLQRQCACGGSAGLTGECEGCKSKKLLGKPLQRKLTINEPGDEYEREADRVAEQVMRMPESNLDKKQNTSMSSPMVQRRTRGGGSGLAEAPPIVQDVLASPGQPLDAATRAFFEPRFGHDFGNVRVHADAAVSESAQAVNALAYTVGQDIVFRTGQFDLQSLVGRRLLAHELTHVIHQRHAGPMVQRQIPLIAPTSCAVPSDKKQIPPTCPTDIRVVKLHPIPFTAQAVRAGWLSGGGVVAEMEVSDPTNRAWTNTNIHETTTPVADGNCGTTKLCINVGTGGAAGSTWPVPEGFSGPGLTLPRKTNTFYDWHFSMIGYDVLGREGLTSCTSECEQTYDCVGGNALRPKFSIVRTLTPDNLGGSAVTQIAVSKTVK